MMRTDKIGLAAATIAVGLTSAAGAEVLGGVRSYYKIRHEATSELAPDAMWARLVEPAEWWSDDHTYSGDADNLSLDLRAGGLWLEKWDGGSVAHGEVLYVKEGEVLRLSAPFGPLQGMAVNTVWTITVSPEGEGSKVVFEEIANGGPASNLQKIVTDVDKVKGEAIALLVGAPKGE
ncbi:MAG: SRPBCC domain-containing protein [Parvularculaceae bacterium]